MCTATLALAALAGAPATGAGRRPRAGTPAKRAKSRQPRHRRIEEAAHFKPCLFRPPGGGVDSSVIAAAAVLGMWTVTWDVDPTDWSNPGSGAVCSHIAEATRPGSIVLMHDGGGRSGALAALPGIIDTPRGRGYRFTTVTELLGGRVFCKPYG